MHPLIYAIIATIIVSLLSLVGIFFVSFNKKKLDKIILLLVGLSAGALMGGALLHLLPEASKSIGFANSSIILLLGFSLFFIIERFLHWHHCHKYGKCDIHTFTYMNLIGDSIHNLIDGIVIAASFITSIPLGIATTIAVISHEIPQEIGDFGVLVYGGFSKFKALLFNLLTALTAVIGAFIGYFLSSIENFTPFILPFAAGGFIYISASDLIPELHKESNLKKSLFSFTFFLVGIALMYGIRLL